MDDKFDKVQPFPDNCIPITRYSVDVPIELDDIGYTISIFTKCCVCPTFGDRFDIKCHSHTEYDQYTHN